MKHLSPKQQGLKREIWKKSSWGFKNENLFGNWIFQLIVNHIILTFPVNQIKISNFNIYLTQKLRTNLLSGAERIFWIQNHTQNSLQAWKQFWFRKTRQSIFFLHSFNIASPQQRRKNTYLGKKIYLINDFWDEGEAMCEMKVKVFKTRVFKN